MKSSLRRLAGLLERRQKLRADLVCGRIRIGVAPGDATLHSIVGGLQRRAYMPEFAKSPCPLQMKQACRPQKCRACPEVVKREQGAALAAFLVHLRRAGEVAAPLAAGAEEEVPIRLFRCNLGGGWAR